MFDSTVDSTYNIGNGLFTTSLPQNQQGLVMAVVRAIILLGVGFPFGLADTAISCTTNMD